MDFKNDELINLMMRALKRICERDSDLIQRSEDCCSNLGNHSSEPSIVFRFALYFDRILRRNPQYKGLDLDCEYNRHNYDEKELNYIRVKGTEKETYKVVPDVILHKRGIDDKNTMVIEFKGYWGESPSQDENKLKAFTDNKGAYKYLYGVSVIFGKKEMEAHVYMNGELIEPANPEDILRCAYKKKKRNKHQS